MRVQDYIADAAEAAGEEFFRYASAVPAGKLGWAPEGGKSTLDMAREIAITPTWTMDAFGMTKREWSEEEIARQKAMVDSWGDIETCEREFAERFEAVEAMYRGFSDEDLAKTKWLPYNGGRDHTFLEMMDYPRWNATYHTGQVAYLQTLLGDREMH